MDLNSLFQISASIFFILASLFLLVLLAGTISLKIQLNRLIKKLEEVTETAKTATGEAKEFIERTIESLEKFKNSILTFEFIQKLVSEIINLIKSKKKGDKDEEAN